MKNYHFKNDTEVPISTGPANTISSTINVQDTGGNIQDVNVKLDIRHTWTSDLKIKLTNPDGLSVMLVSRKGGSGDNFEETLFDEQAGNSINDATPPFHGTFKPQESLDQFNGSNANGNWTLEIEDTAAQDGGALKTWELEIITDESNENTGPFLFHNRTVKAISPEDQIQLNHR